MVLEVLAMEVTEEKKKKGEITFLEPKKIKSVTVSIVSPSICHEVMGTDAMILVFLNVEF